MHRNFLRDLCAEMKSRVNKREQMSAKSQQSPTSGPVFADRV